MIKICLKLLPAVALLCAIATPASAKLVDYNFYAIASPWNNTPGINAGDYLGYITYDDAMFDGWVSGHKSFSNSLIVDLSFDLAGYSATLNDVDLSNSVQFDYNSKNITGASGYLTTGSNFFTERLDIPYGFWLYVDAEEWTGFYGEWVITDTPVNSQVPVPATALLFAAGLLGFSVRRKTK